MYLYQPMANDLFKVMDHGKQIAVIDADDLLRYFLSPAKLEACLIRDKSLWDPEAWEEL